jgi:hypothetical protein
MNITLLENGLLKSTGNFKFVSLEVLFYFFHLEYQYNINLKNLEVRYPKLLYFRIAYKHNLSN